MCIMGAQLRMHIFITIPLEPTIKPIFAIYRVSANKVSDSFGKSTSLGPSYGALPNEYSATMITLLDGLRLA